MTTNNHNNNSLDAISQYLRWQSYNLDKVKCFICQNTEDADYDEAKKKYILMKTFDNREKDKQGGIELQYSLCPDCFPIVKQKLIQHGDMSDMMTHTCNHILEREAQTSTTGNHEYLCLKSPNELTRTTILLSKVNISIWGNPRKIGISCYNKRLNSSSFKQIQATR